MYQNVKTTFSGITVDNHIQEYVAIKRNIRNCIARIGAVNRCFHRKLISFMHPTVYFIVLMYD
jgi:hypothetical protein